MNTVCVYVCLSACLSVSLCRCACVFLCVSVLTVFGEERAPGEGGASDPVEHGGRGPGKRDDGDARVVRVHDVRRP